MKRNYTAPKKTRALTTDEIQALLGNQEQVAFGRPTKCLTTRRRSAGDLDFKTRKGNWEDWA